MNSFIPKERKRHFTTPKTHSVIRVWSMKIFWIQHNIQSNMCFRSNRTPITAKYWMQKISKFQKAYIKEFWSQKGFFYILHQFGYLSTNSISRNIIYKTCGGGGGIENLIVIIYSKKNLTQTVCKIIIYWIRNDFVNLFMEPR